MKKEEMKNTYPWNSSSPLHPGQWWWAVASCGGRCRGQWPVRGWTSRTCCSTSPCPSARRRWSCRPPVPGHGSPCRRCRAPTSAGWSVCGWCASCPSPHPWWSSAAEAKKKYIKKSITKIKITHIDASVNYYTQTCVWYTTMEPDGLNYPPLCHTYA